MTEDWLSNLPRVEGAASPELRAESLKRLRQQLLQMLSKELPLFFDELDEILFAASSSDNSPQNQFDYFQAMGKLRKSKRETLPRIIDAFKERYDQLILINEDVPATRRGGSVELEVLDEDVLEDMIALDNLVSRAVDASQPTLAYLTRRLEYLVGWTVSLSDNPFIPEAICESFLAQLTKIAITQAARNTCVEQFSKWLHRVWPQVVADCNRTLVSLDVLPSLEASKKTIKKTATRNPATDKTTGSPSEQPRKASSDNAEGSGIPTQSTAGQTQKPESPNNSGPPIP